ncbi:hypothetical protein TD95_000886 [Thielaviopsis punctulata]|uniref:Uncharacterized protein n=1 Tax=Thielaviopsis punctulata TaxID=72032 RepID=A0A0F4Z8B7_9PEZI|nr:hypothetical protein TD95_000886 [Thielaviopsis punctulata]
MSSKKLENADNVSEKYFSDSGDDSEFGGFDDAEDATNRDPATLVKDAAEEELERLVLGNSAGFRRQLFDDLEAVATDAADIQLTTTDADADAGVEDLDDDDLFDFDFASTGEKKPTTATAGAAAAGAPAWEDSDDERMTVSLVSHTRLRKFRVAGQDDTVNGAVYTDRLRQQYLHLNPTPKWAQHGQALAAKRRKRSPGAEGSSSSSDDDEDTEDYGALPIDKFLRDAGALGALGATKRRKLRPEVIDIQRSRDIPDVHGGAVTALSFHPQFPILLSSSPSSIMYLHHIDPQAHPVPNPRLTSVQARQVDVRHSEFRYPAGDKVVFAGRRRYYHSWDLETGVVQKTSHVHGHKKEHKTFERFKLSPCGRYMGIIASTRKGGGIINVVDTNTSNWLAAARLDSRNGVADFAWWSTGDGMTILGRDGSVGEYSMVDKRFLGLWRDDGCIGGIVIALGGHQGPEELGEDAWVAVGSSSGITNIYNRHTLFSVNEQGEVEVAARPTPTKVFEQLITPVTTLTFSPDGQLLAFASREKRDAMRLAHIPSCTVYRNWPTADTPLGRISAVAFSTDSKVLAVGNDNGKIRTWEIRS